MRKDTHIPYVYQKRDFYYFSRRVPKDLLGHYKRPSITLSLRTKSARVARAKSSSLAAQLRVNPKNVAGSSWCHAGAEQARI